MNAAQKPDHRTQNAESQAALTGAALNEVNEGQESPIQHTNAGSVISGLSIDQNWDADSAVGTERMSSTDSVRSSIYDYVEENGRRYHKYLTRRESTTFQTMKTSKTGWICSIIYSC